MNVLVYILGCLLAFAVIDGSFGFQMGSRGLSELDMPRSQLDIDAGKDKKLKTIQLKTNEGLVKRNKLLKEFTNKEYLFDDLIDPEPTVINTKTEQKVVEISDLGNKEKLKREQRNNPYENLFESELDKIAFDLLKISEIQREAKKPQKSEEKNENSLSFLMNEILKSEDRMKSKDMFGSMIELNTPQPSVSNNAEIEYNYDDLDYLSEKNIQNLYESYLQKSLGAEKSSLHNSEKLNNDIKPVIHYKETFVSSDLFNDKDLNEKNGRQ